MYDEENQKMCDKTENAVKEYVAEIMEVASSYNEYSGELDVNYDLLANSSETLWASSATIVSEFGVAVVFPDFKHKTAKATVLNVGLVNAMQMEGFDEEYINKEGQVYGNLLDKNRENVEMFSYYLTHKLDTKKKSNK